MISELKQIVEAYGFQWAEFRDILDNMERGVLISLFNNGKKHAEAGSNIESLDLFESVVMTIRVEYQKEFQQFEGKILQPCTETCPFCGKICYIEEFFKGKTLSDGITILCQILVGYAFTSHQILLKIKYQH